VRRSAVGLLLCAALATAAWADSRPPASALPLSQVLAALERDGWGPFKEVEFDDGVWEVEVWKGRQRYKLEVDPTSGKVLRERRDD
jgi:hypothetical protein